MANYVGGKALRKTFGDYGKVLSLGVEDYFFKR